MQEKRPFSLRSPVDLYRKIHFESEELRTHPSIDRTKRAYAVMNTVTSAWQMKDWLYRFLYESGQLTLLDKFAGRRIKGVSDFGVFLIQKDPWLDICYQLATGAKHFEEDVNAGMEMVAKFEFKVGSNDSLLKFSENTGIIIKTEDNLISGHELVLLLDYIWRELLLNVGFLGVDKL